jgi:hypothetical protein
MVRVNAADTLGSFGCSDVLTELVRFLSTKRYSLERTYAVLSVGDMNNAVQISLYSYQTLGENTALLAVVKEHEVFVKKVLLKQIDYDGEKQIAWKVICSIRCNCAGLIWKRLCRVGFRGQKRASTPAARCSGSGVCRNEKAVSYTRRSVQREANIFSLLCAFTEHRLVYCNFFGKHSAAYSVNFVIRRTVNLINLPGLDVRRGVPQFRILICHRKIVSD